MTEKLGACDMLAVCAALAVCGRGKDWLQAVSLFNRCQQ
jgi:hypothetical protein